MTSIPSSASEAPRSIFSRLSIPLEAKATNISDFAINHDDPYRHYAPGDIVQGKVSFTALKAVHVTHLVLCLHGFVKIFKNNFGSEKKLSKKSTFPGTGRGKRGPEYFGNGFATIFEDECMICGERSFSRGRYNYGFAIAFPRRPLPSSISFERGRISYMLTATFTRPTAVLPTLSCTCRLSFRDSIDIANVRVPQPRVITLEPVVRRSRSRSEPNSTPAGLKPKLTAAADVVMLENRSTTVEQSVLPGHDGTSRSADPSNSSSPKTSISMGSQRTNARNSSFPGPEKAIKLQVELVRGGCLPGGELTVKVSVNHVRPVRSLHGIIITLYRICHLDREPSTSINKSKETAMALESVPKSRTGLTGLVFSADDPNMTFRVNLAQTTAHLIVDPDLLSAEVKRSVRVPEDVFPTVFGVPGSLLAFRYSIEVIVDVQGKLAGQNYYFQQFIQNSSFSDMPRNTVTFSNQLTSLFRRETSVIAVDIPIVIGTKDSALKLSTRPVQGLSDQAGTQDCQDDEVISLESRDNEDHRSAETLHVSDLQENIADESSRQLHDRDNRGEHVLHKWPFEVPAGTTEKSRLRSAEEQLLPSAPVLEDNGLSSVALSSQPSAPHAADLHNDNEEIWPSSLSAATYCQIADSHQAFANASHSQDDKQEMERKRLLAAASAPDIDQDDEAEGSSSMARPMPEPSAPLLDDDDDDDEIRMANTQWERPEHLPGYQE